MLKLFQICVEGNTGSTGRLAESIGSLVIKHGWESYIAHGRFPRPSKSNILKIGNRLDVYLHGIETRLLDRHCLGSRGATARLVDQIKKIQPDVIHLHHLHGYYINIKILFHFLATANIPVVWTFHDCWSITGHCTHFNFVGCERWKTECYDCPQKREYPASIFADRSTENYYLKKRLFNSVHNMTVVSVSKWLNEVVAHSFMSIHQREVIYNGIDLTIFTPIVNHEAVKDEYGIGDKFFILGVASPWTDRKGLNDFIKLSYIIPEDSVILLVGLNRAQIKGLPPNIIGVGRTESQYKLRDLYAAADLFINFSVEETFGLTTAEALACGTPALVYNVTACPEIVDSTTGFVISRADIAQALNVIKTIRINSRSFYASACRARAERLFNNRERLVDYMNLYQSILTNQNLNGE